MMFRKKFHVSWDAITKDGRHVIGNSQMEGSRGGFHNADEVRAFEAEMMEKNDYAKCMVNMWRPYD